MRYMVLAVVLLLAVTACGGTVADSEPQVVTKTKTVTVYKTPVSCLDALDYADEGFGYAEDGFGIVADMFGHVQQLDSAGLNADTQALDTVTQNMAGVVQPYNDAKTLCREG